MILRRALLALGGVVALALAGIGAVLLLVDPNAFKGELQQVVKDQTGRTLEIQGEMGLTFFPWLGLTVGPTSLGNAPGFGDQPMVKIDAARVRVQLMPLLDKKIKADRVVLDGLTLNLARAKSGQTNWDDLAGASAPAPVEKGKAKAEPAPAPAAAPAAGLAAFSLAGVEITDGKLIWDDQGVRTTVEHVRLVTGTLEPGKPVVVEAGLDLTQGKRTTHAELASQLHWQAEEQVYKLSGTRLTVTSKGDGLPAAGVKLLLEAEIGGNVKGRNLHAEITRLAVQDLLEATARLDVTGLQDKPQYVGDLVIKPVNPRELMTRMGQTPPAMADAKAMTALQLQASLWGDRDRVALKDVILTLDDTKFTGLLEVSRFENPAVKADLKAATLDLDRYLPPRDGKDESRLAAPASAPESVSHAAAQLPLETLRALDLDIKLLLTTLQARKTKYGDVSVHVTAKNGLLKLDPFNAKVYEGKLAATAQVDARGKSPVITIKKSLVDVQINPLLKDVADLDIITGSANMKIDVTATGASVAEIKKSLGGDTSFTFSKGVIKGVDLVGQIRSAYATFKGMGTQAVGEETEFTELSGSARIASGVIRNDDLKLLSPMLKVTGKGEASLAAETVDYLLKANLLKALEGFDVKAVSDLKDLVIPIRVSGKLSDPSYSVDMAELLQSAAKTEIKNKVEEKLGGTLDKKLGTSGVGGALKGLLGQ